MAPPRRKVIDLGFTPRPWQSEVIANMRRFNVVVVHRRAGKSTLALHLLITAALRCTHRRGLFGLIAPTFRQNKSVNWNALKDYVRPIPGIQIREQELRVVFPHGVAIGLHGSDNEDGIRGHGFSGVVLDETSDVSSRTWYEVVRPALSDSNGWAVVVGTPRGANLLSALYFRALTAEADEWYAARKSAFETGAVPADELKKAEVDSVSEATFRQEYLCDIDASAEDVLIPLSLARAASQRTLGEASFYHETRVLGVDVGWTGDASVVVKRQGPIMIGYERFQGLDPAELADQVARIAEDFRPRAIYVDAGGIGAGTWGILNQRGYNAIKVNFGSAASDPERFLNKRVEMWWAVRSWLPEASIPNDELLIADLVGVRYDVGASNKITLESKEKMKQRGLRSPDIADGLAVTFAYSLGPQALGTTPGKCVTSDDPFAETG